MGVRERRDYIDDGLRLECGLVGHLEHDMRLGLLACRNLRDEEIGTVAVTELT